MRFTRKVLSQMSSVSASSSSWGTKVVVPALFTSRSSWPKCATVSATNHLQSASSETSACIAIAWPPAPVTRATTASAASAERL